VLSTDDARTWQARLDERAVVADPRASRLLGAIRSTRFDELRLVIPGPALRPSGMTLTSAEVFADADVLHWQRPIVVTFAAGRPNPPDMPEGRLGDGSAPTTS
jgi:hypothetical protein